MKKIKSSYSIALLIVMSVWQLLQLPVAAAAERSLTIKLSAGQAFQERNNVQIPNDETGDRFSLVDIAGEGPLPAVRLEGIWAFKPKHELRVLLAPLSYTETGDIEESIRFAGSTFSNTEPVEASYRFNSWRIGYRYHWKSKDHWDLWVGGTLKVRDAEIKLSQAGVVAIDDDLGVVPLLHIAGEYRFGTKWSVSFDVDALGGGPGRAIDIGTGVGYQLSRSWRLGAELRALEGGADIDEVYNFAWFNSGLLTLQYSK